MHFNTSKQIAKTTLPLTFFGVVFCTILCVLGSSHLYAQPGSVPYTPQGSGIYSGTTPQPGFAGPAPSFDPYASNQMIGAPPAAVPYNYNPHPVNPFNRPNPVPNPNGSAFPQPNYSQQQNPHLRNPFEWQQGAYNYQQGQGFGQPAGQMVKFQRFLQRLNFEQTWLMGRGDARSFEIHRTELSSTFAIPMMGNIDTPLLVTPGFAFNFLEGPLGDPSPPVTIPATPRGPDMPSKLYDAYLDFAWYPEITPTLRGELGFRTGVWTDFNRVNKDSLRLLGRGLGILSVTPDLDLLLGAVYLDRVRVKLLPAGGFHYHPNPDLDLYIVFPNPKIRKRISSVGNSDWWWYVAGEYGGGSWTVDRAGTPDRIDYNDVRLFLGFEWETETEVRGHIEVGYVFDREILFSESNTPAEFKPHDTVMLRAGIDF